MAPPADESTEQHDRSSTLAAERLSAVVKTTVDAIIVIDRDGIMEFFNPAAERIFGYSAEECLGENVKMLMDSPHRERHDDYLDRYQTTGEARIIGIGRLVEGRRKDGSLFPMELAVSESHFEGRTFYTGIVRDVTERVQAAREREELIARLEDTNAELERFTYTVSHDLKSPLITICGFLGMLERDAESGNMERLRADIARIERAADKMKQLLDELLELSRIGRVTNPPEAVDAQKLVADVLELLSGPIEQRGVEVEVADDLPVVFGDRVRLREVFQNLLENAMKFFGDQPDPRVSIGVAPQRAEAPGQVVLFVRDNGIGIDPRYLKKIFGLFEQLEKNGEGSGIGLALVHRIIAVHGGKIWAESEGPGTGTTFYLSLPLAPTPEAGAKEKTA